MTRTGGNLLWRPQKGNVVFHTLCKRVQTKGFRRLIRLENWRTLRRQRDCDAIRSEPFDTLRANGEVFHFTIKGDYDTVSNGRKRCLPSVRQSRSASLSWEQDASG